MVLSQERQQVDSNLYTVEQIFTNVTYTLDYYQRDFAWETQQISDLMSDLVGAFEENWRPGHTAQDTRNYSDYFLGPITISRASSRRKIVDGQQRLTSLTLLLTHLTCLLKQAGRNKPVLNDLIATDVLGQDELTISHPDRDDVVRYLLQRSLKVVEGQPQALFTEEELPQGVLTSLTAQNIAARYKDIEELFPYGASDAELVPFVYWLLNNVKINEIATNSDVQADTIFQTQNDRGLHLSPADLLKARLLSSCTVSSDREKAKEIWSSLVDNLTALGPNAVNDFFRDYFRSQHVSVAYSVNKEYDVMATEYHRWVQTALQEGGALASVQGSAGFLALVERMSFYAGIYIRIDSMSRKYNAAFPSMYYNYQQGYKLQNMFLMALIAPTDSESVVNAKLALGSKFIEIFISERIWLGERWLPNYSKHLLVDVMAAIRGKNTEEIRVYLKKFLNATQGKTEGASARFAEAQASEAVSYAHPFLGTNPVLSGASKKSLRLVLSRLTQYIQQAASDPDTHIALDSYTKHDIEHLIPNDYEAFHAEFPQTTLDEFNLIRNTIGSLALLPKTVNRSLQDTPYKDKTSTYARQNMLVATLSSEIYKTDEEGQVANAPRLNRLIANSGISFAPYESFGRVASEQRSEVYAQLAETIWNPSNL